MSTTKYANAVAAVKAMENQLLSRSDMEQLINAAGKNEITSLIAAKRGAGSGPSSLSEVWDTISGYAPDDRELKILLYRNDVKSCGQISKDSRLFPTDCHSLTE